MADVIAKSIQPLRILHYVGGMDYGGVETLLMTIYRNIDRDKVQFDFLAHNQNDAVFDPEIRELGGNIYKLPCSLSQNTIKYCRDVAAFFKDHPYTVVHAHQNNLSGFLIDVAKRCGVGTAIAHAHIAHPKYVTPESRLAHIIGGFLLRRKADYIFGCSQDAVDRMAKRSFDGEKQHVIKNAINTSRFMFSSQTRDKCREELRLACDELAVVCVGRFFQQKNHEFLLNIFASLFKIQPKSKLLLLGDGILREQLESKTQELGISESVVFLNQKPNINEYLSAMDVFILPSLFEGLGIVYIEAQANGLPCVMSDESAVPKEADVGAGLVTRLSLNDPPLKWAKAILDAPQRLNPEAAQSAVKKAGYDIKDVAGWLQNFYLEHGEK